jgi:hypothetical protein
MTPGDGSNDEYPTFYAITQVPAANPCVSDEG